MRGDTVAVAILCWANVSRGGDFIFSMNEEEGKEGAGAFFSPAFFPTVSPLE